MPTYARPGLLFVPLRKGARVTNKGQRSTLCGAETKHGMPSIGRTEITGLVILLPSNLPTGKL